MGKVGDSAYVLDMRMVDGTFAESTLKFSFHKCDDLEDCEEGIENVWKSTASEVEISAFGSPSETVEGKLYEIQFDNEFFINFVDLTILDEGDYAIVLEHAPSEFAMEVKKSDTGAIVEAEGSDHGDGEHGHGGHGDGDDPQGHGGHEEGKHEEGEHEHEEGEHEHEEGEHEHEE